MISLVFALFLTQFSNVSRKFEKDLYIPFLGNIYFCIIDIVRVSRKGGIIGEGKRTDF